MVLWIKGQTKYCYIWAVFPLMNSQNLGVGIFPKIINEKEKDLLLISVPEDHLEANRAETIVRVRPQKKSLPK